MQNALGMKDGKPIVGSSWRLGGDSGWDVVAVGPAVAEIVGRYSKGRAVSQIADFGGGGRYTFLAYPNEMGLDAKGNPLVGSKWRVVQSDPFFKLTSPSIFTVEPGTRNGGVALSGGTWSPTASMKDPAIFRLVELPPEPAANTNKEGEPIWTPLNRPMLNLEKQAREYESAGDYAHAKSSRQFAATMIESDARIAAEESALKDHRYVAKWALKKLTPGDLACYEMKGLKEFKLHTEASGFMYWD